jgi:hypothetical protein
MKYTMEAENMVKYFRWMSSPADRGNVTLQHGKIYDNEKLQKPIQDPSWKEWKKEGVLIALDDKKQPIKEEDLPEEEIYEPEIEPESEPEPESKKKEEKKEAPKSESGSDKGSKPGSKKKI